MEENNYQAFPTVATRFHRHVEILLETANPFDSVCLTLTLIRTPLPYVAEDISRCSTLKSLLLWFFERYRLARAMNMPSRVFRPPLPRFHWTRS